MDLTPQHVLEVELPEHLIRNPELTGAIQSKIQFAISGKAGGTWLLDLTRRSEWVTREMDGITPDLCIEISDTDFLGLVTKEVNAQTLALTGRLKLKPLNLELALKLSKLLAF